MGKCPEPCVNKLQGEIPAIEKNSR